MTKKLSRNMPRHGHVFSPESRAMYAYLEGKIDEGRLNEIEAGKFFPAARSGLRDPLAPEDVINNPPILDGEIASAGFGDARFMDEPGTHWRKHKVRPGQVLTVSWNYSAPHLSRRWVYFITRNGWDPSQKLSRAQFEDTPFYKVELTAQPFYQHHEALWPPVPTVHDVILPDREGYHVMLAIWEVANSGNAFYQVIDLDFQPAGGGESPSAPTQLRGDLVEPNVAELSWAASTGPQPIEHYTVYRDGAPLARVMAPELSFRDASLAPDSTYTYFLTATDVDGNQSTPSHGVTVRTEAPGEDAPPSPPRNLHSMETTANSVRLMWIGSSGGAGIKHYQVYRNGIQVGTTPPSRFEYTDDGLTANTEYRYFIAAIDNQDRLSLPSNVLVVTTKGDGDEIPEWTINVCYAVGDRVRYEGRVYECLQAHPSILEWSPVKAITLWKEVTLRR